MWKIIIENLHRCALAKNNGATFMHTKTNDDRINMNTLRSL